MSQGLEGMDRLGSSFPCVFLQPNRMEGYDPNREEARIMAHAERFNQRKLAGPVRVQAQPKHEEPVVHGRIVRVIWVDRNGGQTKET